MKAKTKGAVCILASAAGFAVMAAAVRLCDDFGAPVSSFQKSFFRNAVALALAAAAFAKSREPRISAPENDGGGRPFARKALWLLVARSVAGTAGIFGNFYALSHIPVGEAMALNKTAPFFTVLFSWLFLREKPGFRAVFCLVAAFAGVLLVVKPGFRIDGSFASFCGLVGGLGAGIAYTFVRDLGLIGVGSPAIVLFFSAFSCLASVPFMLAGGFDPMTPAQVATMLGAGAGAAVGQFGVTAAYRYAPSRDIAVFDYAGVVFTAILGYFMFGQIPDALSVAGFAAIFCAAAASRR